MKAINKYINEQLVNESDLDNIILTNLAELTDNDVIEDMRAYVAKNVDSIRVLEIWNFLKEKLGNKTKLWEVPPTYDIDKYEIKCKEWAKNISRKYDLDKVGDKEILFGIAFMVNGL